MGVFKNGVGRPSNETIKKRRTIYVLSTLAIIALIASTVYMLSTNFNSKKISGSVENINNIEIKIDENLSRVPYISNRYYYSKPMKYKIEIKNNEKYKVYYMINYDYSKIGQIDSGKSFILYLDENELKDNSSVNENIQIYKSVSDLKNNSKAIVDELYSFYYRKYLVDTYIYDPSGDDAVYSNIKDIKHISMEKEDLTYYYGLENYNFKSYIYINNASSKNYYYRIFNYSDSKVNISKLKSVSECQMVNAQKDSRYVQEVILDSKNTKKTYKVKIYSSESKCKSDKKGLTKSGVVFTDIKRHIFSYNKFIVKKEKTEDLYTLNVIAPKQAKNWTYELYYKKTASTDKWKKVSSNELNGMYAYPRLEQQQYKNETFRLCLKADIDNVSIDKWKADGFKKIKKDGVIWIYKDFVINWKKKKA